MTFIKNNMNNRGFEMSFAWMFAIIVGAVVIFLAIYFTTQFIGTEREIQNTEAGKQIGILLNPVETSLEDAKIAKITTPLETRIYNDCLIKSGQSFGSQKIAVATASGVGEKWVEPGTASSFYNKYVFSDSVVQGKEFIVFSKPFRFPFKVADLLFVWDLGDKYCFVTPPQWMEEELDDLSPEGIKVVGNLEDCETLDIKVCFSTVSNCNIDVNMNAQSVKKNKGTTTVYFEDSLIYGAIFAEPDLYECQVKRLMSRTSELSALYYSKSSYVGSVGCGSSALHGNLLALSNSTSHFEKSFDIILSSFISNELGTQNRRLSCKLF